MCTVIALAMISLLTLPLTARAPQEAAKASVKPAVSSPTTPRPDSKDGEEPQSNSGEAKQKENDSEYLIGIGDVLAINVWKEPEVSREVPVRPDGKISLPLVGEVEANGITPLQLRERIARSLTAFMANPEVTVIVQTVNSQKFNIIGEVQRPGSYMLTKPMTVLDAIAVAGGFREFANKDDIYVLRRKPDGTRERLPFNYKDVVKGKTPEQNVELETYDTIVVP